jgi:hypothetical protein
VKTLKGIRVHQASSRELSARGKCLSDFLKLAPFDLFFAAKTG